MTKWIALVLSLLLLHALLPLLLAATSVMDRPRLWPAFGALMLVRLLVALALPGVAAVAILNAVWRSRG